MREIKFRAWLPVGEWNEDGSQQKYEMVGPDALAFEDYEPLADHLRNCENLMQYTGLKDKNGKEIYEGDIVKLFWPGDKPYDSGRPSKVVFIRGSFGTLFGDRFSAFWWNYDFQFEVIGNIYENPELLK